MNVEESLTRKIGPLPVWAYGVAAGGAVGLYLRLRRKKTTDEPGMVSAEDNPAANFYTLGPVASKAATEDSYVNSDGQYYNDGAYGGEYISDSIDRLTDYLYQRDQIYVPDPYAANADTSPATSVPSAAPGSGVTVQQPSAVAKLFTWAEWIAYKQKTDKTFPSVVGAVQRDQYYAYLRSHGASVLPGSGQPIPAPSATSPAVASNSPGATTANTPSVGLKEPDAFTWAEWLAYQRKTNKSFPTTVGAAQQKQYYAYLRAHGRTTLPGSGGPIPNM